VGVTTGVPRAGLSQPGSKLWQTKSVSDQSNRSAIIEKNNEYHTRSRFAARIGSPWEFKSQFLLMAKGVNPPMGKFLDAMTCSKTGVAEFSYLLDQSS
jgi:hypothetical protein